MAIINIVAAFSINRMKKNLALDVAWFLLLPILVVGTAGVGIVFPGGTSGQAAIAVIRFPADAGTYVAPAKIWESVSSYEHSHKRSEFASRPALAFDRRTISDATGGSRATLIVFRHPFEPTWLKQPNLRAPPSL